MRMVAGKGTPAKLVDGRPPPDANFFLETAEAELGSLYGSSLRVAKMLSATALSQRFPLRLMLLRMAHFAVRGLFRREYFEDTDLRALLGAMRYCHIEGLGSRHEK